MNMAAASGYILEIDRCALAASGRAYTLFTLGVSGTGPDLLPVRCVAWDKAALDVGRVCACGDHIACTGAIEVVGCDPAGRSAHGIQRFQVTSVVRVRNAGASAASLSLCLWNPQKEGAEYEPEPVVF